MSCRLQINVFELALFLAIVLGIFWLSNLIAESTGINRWLALVPITMALGFAIWRLSEFIERHKYPTCANGVCRANDYSGLALTSKGLLLVCKCGRRYLFKSRKFQVLNGEEQPIPFKRKKLLGGWIDDTVSGK